MALLLAAGLALLSTGCTRTFYHLRADREVRRIVTEKTVPGRWGLPGFRLQYDPRSRYFDPTNTDHPPMPPDDPVSHQLMHWVDGKHGAITYHRDGDLAALPNPTWRQQLPYYTDMEPDGTIHLTLEGSLRLALVHSPTYFQQLEELYLSALDVSTERWRFDGQFYGGINPFLYTHRSKNAPAGGTVDSLNDTQSLQMQKRFAAGGELIVGIANSIVWQFAGPDTNSNVSILNFSFVQPLLRGGTRRFILEQLTIVERALVANLRAFERYRQGFYTNLAVGDGGTTGPSRRGGFFGGTGLTGFSGQGSGGFGEVGTVTGFGRGNNPNPNANGGVGSGFAGGGAGTVGGYIGILQQTQQVRNSQQNLAAQLRTLKLLEANLEAGVIDIAQVDQFRQNIETARATLLQSEITVTNALETFKRTTLGLPPDLPVELDDAFIRPFQFLEPTTNDLHARLEDFVDELGELPETPEANQLAAAFERLAELHGAMREQLGRIRGDVQTMQSRAPERHKTQSADERVQFDKKLATTAADLEAIEMRFDLTNDELAELYKQAAEGDRKKSLARLVPFSKDLATLLQEASLVQVRARLESVTLEPVKLDMHEALAIARANRLDWMNNRAAVVDTWRLIAFNANALLSTVNLTVEGNMNTRGDNPVKFQASTGSVRAGITFDAPFTRLLEQNNYRAVLIDYQRDRRTLIQFEDLVNQSLRQSLRNLDQLERNLEIQRRAVDIAARRVDQTRETLNKPPEASVAGQTAASQFGPTAALNLLTAMNDLQSSQNNFMSVWLNHYATRMVLIRELGIMELDGHNQWIDRPLDEQLATAERCYTDPLPPDVPQEWFEALDAELLPNRTDAPRGNDAPAADDKSEELPAGKSSDGPKLEAAEVPPLSELLR
jgi:hypothetical protein